MLGFRNTVRTWFLGIACSVNTLFVSVANAQITPDSTLPNNSDVKLEGNINKIEGGTTAGSNLFHSLKKFSIPTGSEAHFNNAVDISNIITRVTGKSISNIDGLIKANGTANLFLINPSGIVFGENARLDIGGSFVGSTADAIGFGEDNFFSASSPENSSSLLKVNPNALFFNQVKTASIQNNSVADLGLENIVVSPSTGESLAARGLRVPDAKSLILLGGNVNIDGGGLVALGGRVELGGLAGKGTVGLNGDENNLSLSFPDGVERTDVFLSNGAGVAVIADNGGSIAVNARNLEMTGQSLLFAGIESGLGSDKMKAGNIDIYATLTINLKNKSLINNNVQPRARGQGGDVNINASTLQIENGTQVSTTTFGEGKGGNLTVDAQKVQLIGNPSGLFTEVNPESTGDAGDLKINTNTLLVKHGAQVNANTGGKGKGGNLTVKAQKVQLIGNPSGLFAGANSKSTEGAGDLTINTNTLLVQDGAQVSAGTGSVSKGGNLTVEAQKVQLIGIDIDKDDQVVSGLFVGVNSESTGDAGDLMIKTSTLLLQDGALVGASTFGKGKGGNLTIEAQKVQLIGKSKNGSIGSGLLAQANPGSTGDAGDLAVNTDILQIENGAEISVQSSGTGRAGNLIIDADSIRLNNNAIITANTRSNKVDPETEQATININSQDLIMRRGSNITTNATGENVIGGNINIDTDILAALENSDISANSVDSGGGNVRIESQGIFGTQFRPQSTPQSDITATGVNEDSSGTVEVITPDTDTNSGLVNLPTIPIETEVQAGCTDGSPLAQSSFEITGRSGLPPNPSEALTNDAVLVDLVTLKPEVNKRPTATDSTELTTSKPKKIVEATGFSRNKKGEIFLVADASNGTNHSEWNKNSGCRGLN